MGVLYNLSIAFYSLMIRVASLFNEKAKLWVRGRKNIWNDMAEKINPAEKKAWFHVSSLGEFEQGRPLIEEFKKKYPEIKVLLTFFSPSGYEVRKNFEYADYVFYLPLDTPSNTKKFIKLVNPSIVFFVKYDFWFNYIRCIAKNNIPLLFASSIFRKSQHFFKWYGWWFRKRLKYVTHFYVQDASSEKLLKSIGINQVTVCGDTRFDRVYSITQNVKPFPDIQKFCEGSDVIVAGSTWPPDEDILISLIHSGKTPYKLIMAPHVVDKAHISEITAKLKVPYLLYSEISLSEIKDKKVLIIDCIGILSHVYQYGRIGYIGGGFGEGIHNIQEPATFGMPVIFGPQNSNKFREAIDLVKEGGAFCIKNGDDLMGIIQNFINNPDALKKSSEISRDYIKRNVGATEKILQQIEKYI
ncbi:MAG: glycosyltransferase N-terminal domain-containing protein [Bacteroidota bacterium]